MLLIVKELIDLEDKLMAINSVSLEETQTIAKAAELITELKKETDDTEARLRDQFAAAALQTFCGCNTHIKHAIKQSYRYADAMMEARNERD